jgi:hypothetical protein
MGDLSLASDLEIRVYGSYGPYKLLVINRGPPTAYGRAAEITGTCGPPLLLACDRYLHEGTDRLDRVLGGDLTRVRREHLLLDLVADCAPGWHRWPGLGIV